MKRVNISMEISSLEKRCDEKAQMVLVCFGVLLCEVDFGYQFCLGIQSTIKLEAVNESIFHIIGISNRTVPWHPRAHRPHQSLKTLGSSPLLAVCIQRVLLAEGGEVHTKGALSSAMGRVVGLWSNSGFEPSHSRDMREEAHSLWIAKDALSHGCSGESGLPAYERLMFWGGSVAEMHKRVHKWLSNSRELNLTCATNLTNTNKLEEDGICCLV